jgi:hypothetical protein
MVISDSLAAILKARRLSFKELKAVKLFDNAFFFINSILKAIRLFKEVFFSY